MLGLNSRSFFATSSISKSVSLDVTSFGSNFCLVGVTPDVWPFVCIVLITSRASSVSSFLTWRCILRSPGSTSMNAIAY